MKCFKQSALLALLAFGYGTSALANLTFDGTLNEPAPCTINSGSNIEIDFDDIGVNKVDGHNYRKLVNYIITCSAGSLPWEMVLTVTGAATAFESSAVQTSTADLGIRLLQNGVPFELNSQLPISPATPPVLEVVPVKRSGTSLAPGGFSASATLLAEFQ